MRTRAKIPEPKHTFSVNLPILLYQKLVDRAGRGNIGTFVNQVLEKELNKDDQNLRSQLIEAYKREAKSKEVQEEMEVWEGVAGDNIDDE
jgi:hypothetical protein